MGRTGVRIRLGFWMSSGGKAPPEPESDFSECARAAERQGPRGSLECSQAQSRGFNPIVRSLLLLLQKQLRPHCLGGPVSPSGRERAEGQTVGPGSPQPRLAGICTHLLVRPPPCYVCLCPLPGHTGHPHALSWATSASYAGFHPRPGVGLAHSVLAIGDTHPIFIPHTDYEKLQTQKAEGLTQDTLETPPAESLSRRMAGSTSSTA